MIISYYDQQINTRVFLLPIPCSYYLAPCIREMELEGCLDTIRIDKNIDKIN